MGSCTCSSSSSIASMLVVLLVVGCPGDDGPADNEGTSSSGSGTSTTGPTPDGTSSTGPEPTSSTTAVADDTSTGGSSSTGEPPSDGLCVGIDILGNAAQVFSRDGAPIDTTCDPSPMPCGGDPVGTWLIESSCSDTAGPNPFEQDCPSSTFMIEVVAEAGMVTINADGTYVEDIMSTTQALIELDPMVCYGVSCMEFEATLQGMSPSATCQSMGPNCSCTAPLPDPPPTMGTWEVMGTTFIGTDGTTGDTMEIDFCVAGDRLDTWRPIFDVELTDTLCANEQDCLDALGDMYSLYVCGMDEG